MAKDLDIFCLGLNIFPKAELKDNVLISLVEDISRKLIINTITWLLLILMQIYNVKQQKVGQKELENRQLREKAAERL